MKRANQFITGMARHPSGVAAGIFIAVLVVLALTVGFFPSLDPHVLSNDSMVPLRRSSANTRMLSAGHTKSSVMSKKIDSCPKYACNGPVSTDTSAMLEKCVMIE